MASTPSVSFDVSLIVKPAAGVATPGRRVTVDVVFSRYILPSQPTSTSTPGTGPSTDTPTSTSATNQIQDSLRFTLDEKFHGQAILNEAVPSSIVALNFLGIDGRAVLVQKRTVPAPPASSSSSSSSSAVRVEFTFELSEADVKSLTATEKLPEAVLGTISRPAAFVSLIPASPPIDFAKVQLQVAPLIFDNERTWRGLGFQELLPGTEKPSTAAAIVAKPLPPAFLGLDWSVVHVAVDAHFEAVFPVLPKGAWNAWTWLLSGSTLTSPIIGVVNELLETSIGRVRSVFLPAPMPSTPGNDGETEGELDTEKMDEEEKDDCQCHGKRPPPVASEAEMAANPDIFTEDPGSFCKPFSNPARILSERSFHSIVRTEMPVISAEATISLREPAQIDFDPPDEMLDGIEGTLQDPSVRSFSMLRDGPMLGAQAVSFGNLVAGNIWRSKVNAGLSVFKEDMPRNIFEIIETLNRGRKNMDSANPVQWDAESIRYQATTIARGHILEFRIRTRSNGYSLGGVSKTLTLAPRQTKRIQKIEWSRSERAARDEDQISSGNVNDSSTRETSYQDAVAANLNEWARGSSSSKVTSAAAGAGAILGPVAIGGGVAHSSSSSKSQQEGGRATTAKEESQWRDALRRHGDELRKFESTVVEEIRQTENVTGTVEVIRNINYAHSLTVIYHNILRHYRVDTEFGGARECLFVPFAMKPWTMPRAYRWRESIQRSLLDRRFVKTMRHLKDVLTSFRFSKIPPKTRSVHQMRSLYGSVYIELGVSRPGDLTKGEFNFQAWDRINRLLGFPAFGIWSQLGTVEGMREFEFQRRFAPGIAAKWCNSLELYAANGTKIDADFTLASTYSFNRTVRIDFQVANPGSLNRSMLTTIMVRAGETLAPGSVAHLRSLTYTYQTDYETRNMSASQGIGDLVHPSTGDIDTNGAFIQQPLTQYDLQNLRAELVYEVVELLQHLNENIEHYHRMIWWTMDRDRLFMLLDGFFVPGVKPETSVASVVERNPIGVAGNSLIFRVSAGCFIGTAIGNAVLDTSEALDAWYKPKGPKSDPMHISLPTDGLYAQTIMDECGAVEDHYGNTDWALNDPDPELGMIDPSLLMSRRADPGELEPSKMPETLINLQNAMPAPAPQGLGGVLGAVQNGNAFRDMAGLAGTQGLAAKGLETAAALATAFGGTAAAVKIAEMANKQQATNDLDKKIASVKKAVDSDLMTKEDGRQHINESAAQTNGVQPAAPTESEQTVKETKEVIKMVEDNAKKGNITQNQKKQNVQNAIGNTKGVKPKPPAPKQRGLVVRLIGYGGLPLQGFWKWNLTQSQIIETPVQPPMKPNEEQPFVNVDKILAQSKVELFYQDGRILMSFPFDENTAETYNFHLEGRLMGTNVPDLDVVAGKGLQTSKGIMIQIPRSVFEKANVATATVTAFTEEFKVSNKKGREVMNAWKVGGEIGGKSIPVLRWLAEISGNVSGELSEEEAKTNETEQSWSLHYYTGGFTESVTVN